MAYQLPNIINLAIVISLLAICVAIIIILIKRKKIEQELLEKIQKLNNEKNQLTQTTSTLATELQAANDIIHQQKEKTDIHEAAAAAEAIEERRAKNLFLSRISHEIRSPISSMLGISEIQLQNPNISVKIEESFSRIHDSAKVLLSLVNDIIDFAKMEDGKLQILQEEYDTVKMINHVTNMCLVHQAEKPVKFILEIDENIPIFLIGDLLRVEQMLLNLLSNAFKYTKEGFVKLSFSCKPMEGVANRIMLEAVIQDTGTGMTKAQLETVYSNYTLFHEGAKSGIDGTGLGMSIVYNLIKLMSAYIEIDSQAGAGTTVILRIPQIIDGTEKLGPELAQKLQQFESSARYARNLFKFNPEPMPYGTVLIVDDVETHLYLTEGLLAYYGLTIETCSNGFDALDKIKDGNIYDIIFMDHLMAEMDGIQTMKAMRNMGYMRPIIAMTACALAGQGEKYDKLGFDGFLSKPILTKKLNDMLVKHIKTNHPAEVIESAARTGLAHLSPTLGQMQSALPESDKSDDALRKKLRLDFAKNQKNAFADIMQALDIADAKTAQFLLHTLKGLAKLIKEIPLANAAEKIEGIIENGGNPSQTERTELETELTQVIEAILADDDNPYNIISARERHLALLEDLKYMLQQRKNVHVELVDQLRPIPEAAILIKQLETLQFSFALRSVDALKAVLEAQ